MKKRVPGKPKNEIKSSASSKLTKTKYHHEDLREKILEESLKIIYETGVSSLSLRDVARKLGVSHSAPYRHFQTKDDVLLALGLKGFKLFTEYLNRNLPLGSSKEKVVQRFDIMRQNYLDFASEYNTLYHFMFGINDLNYIKSEELQKLQEESFSTLIHQIATMQALNIIGGEHVFESAFFCFVMMHGLSTMKNNGVMEYLANSFSYKGDIMEKMMEFVYRGMNTK